MPDPEARRVAEALAALRLAGADFAAADREHHAAARHAAVLRMAAVARCSSPLIPTGDMARAAGVSYVMLYDLLDEREDLREGPRAAKTDAGSAPEPE